MGKSHNKKPENDRRPSEYYPLRGLFDQDSFILPEIDYSVIDFLSEICLKVTASISENLHTLCLISFYRHPSYYLPAEEIGAIFYRWAIWKRGLGISSRTTKYLRKPIFELRRKNCLFTIGSADFWYDDTKEVNSLSAEFLAKYKLAVEKKPAAKVQFLKLDPKKGTKPVPVKRHADGFWPIDAPGERCNNFFHAFRKHRTDWCLYRPIQVAGQIAGLVSIDGMGPEGVPTRVKRAPLAAAVNLLELSFEALFKKYYRQMDYDPGKVKAKQVLDAKWQKWDCSGVVYSSEFERDIVSALVRSRDEKIRRQDKKGNGREVASALDLQMPLKRLDGPVLIAYFDGNGIKQINDDSSHLVGNEVIRAMGRWLHDSLWVCAISGDKQPLAAKSRKQRDSSYIAWVIRIGGDEFRIVLACPKKYNVSLLLEAFDLNVASYLSNESINPVGVLAKGLSALKDAVYSDAKDDTWLARVRKVGFAGACTCVTGLSEENFKDACDKIEPAMYIAKSIIKNPKPPHGFSSQWPLRTLCMDCESTDSLNKSIAEAVENLVKRRLARDGRRRSRRHVDK